MVYTYSYRVTVTGNLQNCNRAIDILLAVFYSSLNFYSTLNFSILAYMFLTLKFTWQCTVYGPKNVIFLNLYYRLFLIPNHRPFAHSILLLRLLLKSECYSRRFECKLISPCELKLKARNFKKWHFRITFENHILMVYVLAHSQTITTRLNLHYFCY